MHGWKLDYLKDALNLFLKSMPTVNIQIFNKYLLLLCYIY